MAKLVDAQSTLGTASVLDIYSVPPTQVSFEQGYWQELNLSNTCTSEGPWTFIVQSDPHYLHLARNYIYAKIQIKQASGAAMIDNTKVAPINLIGKTLFNQVKVLVNGKQAFDSGGLYAYRTYIETLLNYGKEAKEGIQQAGVYYKDEPAEHINDEANTGWTKRKALFQNSKVVEIMAPIHCDFFLADRLLPSNSEITLELHRSPNDFVIMNFTGADPVQKYTLEVTDMKWYVRKLEVTGSVNLGIESVLSRTPAKYPLRRIEMSNMYISDGRYSVPTTPVFNGQLPRRLVIGFIEEDAFFGNQKKSPFAFKHHNVKEISIQAGGYVFPRAPIKADFGNDQYVRAYVQMLEGLGIADDNKGIDINMKDFKLSSCLFVFDLTPEEQDVGNWHLIREGTTTVHCDFSAPVAAPGLEMVVYGEFYNCMFLDRTRTVHFDYSM